MLALNEYGSGRWWRVGDAAEGKHAGLTTEVDEQAAQFVFREYGGKAWHPSGGGAEPDAAQDALIIAAGFPDGVEEVGGGGSDEIDAMAADAEFCGDFIGLARRVAGGEQRAPEGKGGKKDEAREQKSHGWEEALARGGLNLNDIFSGDFDRLEKGPWSGTVVERYDDWE